VRRSIIESGQDTPAPDFGRHGAQTQDTDNPAKKTA
jgi:hypothetical protein